MNAYVPTPAVIGVVQASALASTTTLAVDPAYAAYLRLQLATGDWTYAVARVGNQREIMKVLSIDPLLSTILVARGLGSTPLPFAAGQEIGFEVTTQGVQDMLTTQALAPAISIAGAGSVTVTQPSPNQFLINGLFSTVTSSDGSLNVAASLVNGVVDFNVTANTSAIGCCGSGSGGGSGPSPYNGY